MKTVNILLTATLMFLFFPMVQAQLPEKTVKAIDDLFRPWTNTTGPGCAIAVVRHDSILYTRGYGLANLEYGVPITAETPFNVASVSKQFTAFAVLTLVQQGKLRLSDEIRRYLPWFPDLKEKITIQNLLNHTSGIRTADQLLGIAGTRLDDVVTQEDMIKVLSRQRGLNFKPGTQYSYSNSNFLLLAEIVKVLTGKTLRHYTDSVIFRPLGMSTSHFHDRYNELEPEQAASYYRNGPQGYSNAPINSDYVGPGGLYSTAADLSRWIMNFYHPKAGNAATIQLMTEQGRLNDGTVLKAAQGIESDRYAGQLRYSHSGSQGGFHTFISVFPELELGVVVLGNVEDFKPQRASEQIADLFIPRPAALRPTVPVSAADTVMAVLKDRSVQKFLGNYVSDDASAFRVAIRHQKCVLLYETGGLALLTPVSRDTFAVFGHPEVTYVFSINGKKGKVIDQYWPGRSRHFVTYDPRPKTDQQLQAYTGSYTSAELECTYRILLKDHQLILSGDKGKDIPLKLYGEDQLTNNTWFMPNIMMTRDRQNRITGFEVNSDRVMHLPFRRMRGN